MSAQFNEFEKEIRESFSLPRSRAEYKEQLLQNLPLEKSLRHNWLDHLQLGWKLSMASLIMLAIAVFAVGPQRVLGQIQTWLGYVPNRGYVDLNSPMRVLREPVKSTREGVTVEVLSALLTGNETFMEYSVFGIPKEAIPNQESMEGCQERPFLRLPDGQILEQTKNGYPAVPREMNSATLVIPCITNTLPGKVPEHWELPLQFVASDKAPTSLPVVEEKPLPSTVETTSQAINAPVERGFGIEITRVIETPNGYILIGTVPTQNGDKLYQTFRHTPVISDATGKVIATRMPVDSNLINTDVLSALNAQGLDAWIVEFDIRDLSFPLTINYSLQQTINFDPIQMVDLTVDLGGTPALGEPVTVQKTLQIAGQKFTLLSVTPFADGYSFTIQLEGKQTSVGVEILGVQGLGAGGGLNPESKVQSTSIQYEKRPESPLNLRFSNLKVDGELVTLSTSWQPQAAHAPLPVASEDSKLCLNSTPLDTTGLERLNGEGWLLTSYDAQPEKRFVILSGLTLQDQTTLTENGFWAEFSPDGKKVYYVDNGQLAIFDIANQTTQQSDIFTQSRFELSNDGIGLAFISSWADGSSEIDITTLNAGGLYVVSKEIGAELVGWAADGKSLYYLVPSFSHDLWKVMHYDFTLHKSTEIFTITDATAKKIDAHISPDSKWIAYRARDNSSVRLISTDGQNSQLLAENANVVAIQWVKANLIIMTVKTSQAEKLKPLLVNIDDCTIRLVPESADMTIQDIYIP